MAGGRLAEQGVNGLGAVGAAQLVAGRPVAQQARYPRQGLQMIGSRRLRGQQHENQIDRLLVDGVEIDRCLDPGEKPIETVQAGQLPVWDGDAVSFFF